MVLLTFWTICPKIIAEVTALNKNLDDLYAFPESINQQDVYIEDLAIQCRLLEDRIKSELENTQDDLRELILSYIDLRDELDIYSMRKAIRFGRRNPL